MSRYTFSKKGKVRNIIYNVVFLGCLAFISGYLGKFILPFYLHLLAPLFLIGFMLIKVFFLLTITLQVDNSGITNITTNNVSSTITWSEIERIEVIERNSKIVEIRFYKENKCFFNVWNDIENHDLCFQEIIDNARTNNIAMTNLASKKGSPFF